MNFMQKIPIFYSCYNKMQLIFTDYAEKNYQL